MHKPVTKAVFPVAGLGTRFLPATKAMPKEMLPIVDKPLIQYAVEEAYAAGIRQMIFVTGRTKRPIEDHFDMAYELENELEINGKDELLDLVRRVKPDDMQCVYVRQARALGLGHAVLCARQLVGDEPFAVLLADDLLVGEPPVLAQMVAQYELYGASILAVQDVSPEQVDRYGIVTGTPRTEVAVEVDSIVEKPSVGSTDSTLAVVGRYVLTPRVFELIELQPRGALGEIQLTDGICALLKHENVYAYRYRGRRYDCGSKLGFLQATVDLAGSHPEVSKEFNTWLASRRNTIENNGK
jgi:UTP--glucose-1-phosphate uridylyltransferase